jgi:hypothetical protein
LRSSLVRQHPKTAIIFLLYDPVLSSYSLPTVGAFLGASGTHGKRDAPTCR